MYDGEGAVIFSKFVRAVLNFNSLNRSSPTPDARQAYLLREIQCRGESIWRFTDFRIFVEFSFGSYQWASSLSSVANGWLPVIFLCTFIAINCPRLGKFNANVSGTGAAERRYDLIIVGLLCIYFYLF
jgi:hypothetical protein